jgi:GNAT superfamily N-acetyltransferase
VPLVPFVPGNEELDRAFARVYESSFPNGDCEDTAELLAGVGELGRRAVAWMDPGLRGIATWMPLSVPGVTFLEYMAVAEPARNNGLGGAMLKEIFALLHAESGEGWVVWEVQQPYAAVGAERDLRTRRVGFFERHGAEVLTGAPLYRAPRFDGPGSLPFHVMARPIPASGGQLEGTELQAVVKSLLVDGYNISGDSEFVANVLADLVV